jgi:hypothetical protein
MFLDICRQRNVKIETFKDVLDVFCNSNSTSGSDQSQSPNLVELLPELSKLLYIALTIPTTTCTAERSFSALRRLKSYLRSNMTQERLNHISVINIHRDVWSDISLAELESDFISRCNVRRSTFSM